MSDQNIMNKYGIPLPAIIGVIIIILVATFGSRFVKSVPAGHVAVATIFGKVIDKPYDSGLHIPVNPLYKWHEYDVRNKSHKETANVPSQDQLQTSIEVSVQYHIKAESAPRILKETGTAHDMETVHLVPKLRSILREQGKSIERAEDFFMEKTQETLQTQLLTGMTQYLDPKGLEVQAVLLRDIQLPNFITRAIEAKKEREQEVEKQKAELERFRTEQKQLLAEAQAKREAAEEEAEMVRVLAEAKAFEIGQINKAIGENPNYLQLQAMEALKAISKDPSAKIYFLDGSSPSPLPLMHIGDPTGKDQ